MASIFELNTNEGTLYLETSYPVMRECQMDYIRAKRAEGVPLSDIVFCYGPVAQSNWQNVKNMAKKGRVTGHVPQA
jgi:hypothetical protein